MTDVVETVLGPVPAESLGRTITHEHFSLDFKCFYKSPPDCFKPLIGDQITLENVGLIKQYPYGSQVNLDFRGKEVDAAVLYDVQLYKSTGGGTIIENTSLGLNRNTSLMQRVSQNTGVHVVAGTGYYVGITQSESVLSMTEESMHHVMVKELTDGCLDNPSVKCGFIGEVGSSWPITDFEKRAIRATAQVQSQLKCAVTFHPGRDPNAPHEVMRYYLEAGGDPKRAIMSHIDRTLLKLEEVLEFASLGSFCQLDLFGTECSWYQLHPATDMPSDAQRVDIFCAMVNEGRTSQLLGAHDIHTRHRLVKYGGHGYSHLFVNVIPKMIAKGLTQNVVDTITIENPRVWLTGTRT